MSKQHFVTLGAEMEEQKGPADDTPSDVVQLVFGIVLGAFAGICFAGWEAALLGWLGLGVPTGSLGQWVLALYAFTGALFGGIAGYAGHRGGAWAVATLVPSVAWMLSGKVAISLEEIGIPDIMAPVIVVPMAIAVTIGVLAMLDVKAENYEDASEWEPALLGLALAGFTAAVILLPVNLHLIGDPFSRIGLAIDFVVISVAVVVGLPIGLLLGEQKVFIPLFALGTVGGWAVAFQKLGPVEQTWPTATEDKTPIVLVVVDTLRADHLGAYGYDRPTSPNLDALAKRSIVYTDAASTASWTLPSFGSIVTGRQVHRHGAGLNDGESQQRTMMRADVPTLAERLSESGYTTAGVVTNHWMAAPYGFHRGFDAYDDAVGPWPLPVGLHPLQTLELDPLGWPLYRDATTMTDSALDFIERQEKSGWFLLVHYMDPHGPHDAPAEDVDAVGTSEEYAFTDEYDASIHYTDRELGRLLEAVPKNAWVIVVSDHGEQIDENRVTSAMAPPRTRHGHNLHRELLHVPLIVRAPGRAGRKVSRPVSLVDITPTVLEVAGAEPLEELEGQPLAEVFGRRAAPSVQLALGMRYGAEQQAVRKGDHKLIRNAEDTLIYNIATDPTEKEPIPTVEEEYTSAKAELVELVPVLGQGEGGIPPRLGAEVMQLLEALGYSEGEAEEPAGDAPTEDATKSE